MKRILSISLFFFLIFIIVLAIIGICKEKYPSINKKEFGEIIGVWLDDDIKTMKFYYAITKKDNQYFFLSSDNDKEWFNPEKLVLYHDNLFTKEEFYDEWKNTSEKEWIDNWQKFGDKNLFPTWQDWKDDSLEVYFILDNGKLAISGLFGYNKNKISEFMIIRSIK